MSVRLNASGDYLRRTTDLPHSDAYTFCGWANVVADRGSGSQQNLLTVQQPDSFLHQLQWNNGGNMCVATFAGATAFASRPALNTWFFWAMTSNGSTGAGGLQGYWSPAYSNEFLNANRPSQSFTPNSMSLGNSTYNQWANARFLGAMCWNRILTANELRQQKNRYRPLNPTALNFWWQTHRHDLLRDFGPNRRDPTIGGTLTTEPDMPALLVP